MSLLDEQMEIFITLDRITKPDGYGGRIETWEEGAQFRAVAVLDTSMQARVADAQGVKSLYTITTGKSINLQYHEVIRRSSDDKIFRVTSDGDDKKTPASASLNMRQVTAEEWELPSNNG